MPLWGNTDTANSKPLFDFSREVREVGVLVTANTVTGNTLYFKTAIPTSIGVGAFVYTDWTTDTANVASRCLDGSFMDQNDVTFIKANNTVAAVVDAANGVLRLANNVIGSHPGNVNVFFANTINYNNPLQANLFSDTVLVTSTRTSTANSKIGGNTNQGWNYVYKKTNSDGTVRYIRECLIALANPTAANTASGNTSWGQAFANT